MKFEIIENEGLELIGIVKKIEMKKGQEECPAFWTEFSEQLCIPMMQAGRPLNDKQTAVAEQQQDFSTTNLQVTGVDESDIVKTDGEYIYAISGNSLLIFKAQDGKADRLCRLDLSAVCGENFYAYELYVLGDTIAVTGATSSDDVTYGRDLSASVYVFDIGSRTAPKLSGSASQDGYFVSSRLYDGKLYLVSAYYIYGDISEDDPVSYIPRISENGKDSLMPCSCICIMPFSAMPTMAMRPFTPGNTSCTTAPPSSTTSAGVMPRLRSSSTTAGAPLPATSSSPEKLK